MWEGIGAHTTAAGQHDGVGIQCGVWRGRGPGVDEGRGKRPETGPADRPSPRQGPLCGSSCPSSSHLAWGVQQQEAVSETGEGRGGSSQHGEAGVLPSKLVLELFAVHMPICFVIAWLFLEATGVSRKPESVDCVSSVWGV